MLRGLVVEGLDKPIPAGTNFRDLGSHLSSSARATAPTITQRLERAVECAEALAPLPAPLRNK
eukprot:2594129-Alexandrium_andersonii.AAC.1